MCNIEPLTMFSTLNKDIYKIKHGLRFADMNRNSYLCSRKFTNING